MPFVNIDLVMFDTDDLIEELEARGYKVYYEDELEDKEITESSKTKMPSIYTIRRDFNQQQLREHLEHITGCGGYQTNEEVLNKLKQLLS